MRTFQSRQLHFSCLNVVRSNLIVLLCIILLFHKGVVITASSDLLAHLDMMLILKNIFMRGVSSASNRLKILSGSASLSSPSSISFLQQEQCMSSSAFVVSGGSGNCLLGNVWSKPTSSLSLITLFGWLTGLEEVIWNIKRTYQPSVVRRKRKHGLIARLVDRNGRKVLQRRFRKKRSRVVTCL